MAKDKIISKVTYWGVIGLLTLAFVFFLIFNVYKEYKEYRLSISQLKEAVIDEKKQVLGEQIKNIISLINLEEKLIEDHLKNQLKDEVNMSVSILESVYSGLKGKLEDQFIKDTFLTALRSISIDNGRRYFFVTAADKTGIVLANRAFPDIENKSMWNYRDIYGKYVQRAFYETVKRAGEGFVEYYWYMPENKETPYKKIAYVKLFKPFNWIIGTGDYVEYLRENMKQEMAQVVSTTDTGTRISVLVLGFDGKCYSGKEICEKFSFVRDSLKEGFSQKDGFLMYTHVCSVWDVFITVLYPVKNLDMEISGSLSSLRQAMQENIAYSTASGIVFYLFLIFITDRFLKRMRKTEEELKEKENTLLKERRMLFTRLYKDSVTDLPNRNKFNIDLQLSDKSSIAIINIDRFREINDLFGYQFGDHILRTLANFIKRYIKNHSRFLKVYRISGDEFVVADIRGSMEKAKFENLIEDLVEKINTMIIRDENNAVNINVSAGVALKEENPLPKADIALKEAKKNREKPVAVYHRKLGEAFEYREDIHWIEKIKSALREDRIVNYYQPIVDNKTGRPVKYEALVRLIDEDGKVYTPYYFLNVAKKFRLYPEISRRVIKNAVDIIKEKKVHISVNLSLSDILNIEMRNYILKLLREHQIGEYLTFELLEDESIESSSEVIEFIGFVKMYGVSISIDDFGSGYSNFSYLSKLKVDFIKIDGSLIKNLNTDETSRAIVEAIVTFARELKIKTIAEFVENEDIWNIVKTLEVDYSQGYFCGKPSLKILD
jgi:diguanylate cyclase (GGDEF)-like protein